MGVDKFGRSDNKKGHSKTTTRAISVDNDLRNKRLMNVGSPLEDGDAVNLQFLLDKLKRYQPLIESAAADSKPKPQSKPVAEVKPQPKIAVNDLPKPPPVKKPKIVDHGSNEIDQGNHRS